MNASQITKLCAWSLGLILFWTTASYGQSTSISTQQQQNRQSEILQELAKADVVYLGETHSSPEDHQAQLEIIKQLYGRASQVAIAMEMFQRPYQQVLDRYLAGQLSETELRQQSQYEQRWGFPWEYYAPLLRFAKENHLPVLALNTPKEVTRKVAREGLESLTESELRFIPPISEIRTDNAEYRQMLLDAYKQHQAHGSTGNFERFFTAQVLWDETMAEAIADFIKAKPNYKVVVLAGQGHIVYGYGIPSRVARRLGIVTGNRRLVQRSVLLSPPEDTPSGKKKPSADFVWQRLDKNAPN